MLIERPKGKPQFVLRDANTGQTEVVRDTQAGAERAAMFRPGRSFEVVAPNGLVVTRVTPVK